MSNTNTSLHLAVQNGNIDIVKMLLDAGHSPDEANVEGLTSLDIAIQLGHTEIVALFSEKNKENRGMPSPPHISDERNDTMLKFNKDKIFTQQDNLPPPSLVDSFIEWGHKSWLNSILVTIVFFILMRGIMKLFGLQ